MLKSGRPGTDREQNVMAPYVGSTEYCYSHSAAMLLASAGHRVEPGLFECLTAVGLGARWWPEAKEIYFSLQPPDLGTSAAFAHLGFEVEERTGVPDLDALRAELETAPIMIGPLDMGWLRYLPNAELAHGADHYVLLVNLTAEHARLHDPKGYLNVTLPLEHLAKAWEAEAVSYRREPYRRWSHPRQRSEPSCEQLRRETIEAMNSVYRRAAADTAISGQAAFAAAADHLRQGEADGLLHLFRIFCLPLGARRAHDLAEFLEPAAPALAEIKHEQALAFIDGYREALANESAAVAETVLRIGALDADFEKTLRDD